MAISPVPSAAISNRIVASLPREEYERLSPHLEPVRFEKGQLIHHAGDKIQHAHFVETGMLSMLSTTSRGEVVEVAMVGNEGLLGISIILGVGVTPYDSTAQLTTDALRINAAPLVEVFNRGGKLHELTLKYAHGLLAQITQSAVCNHFHTVEERLCRWLLVASDRLKSNTLELTQEIISQMLGTRRTGVTKAACALQDAGLIRYRRGKITIIDRGKLERAACECYDVVKKEVDQLLAA